METIGKVKLKIAIGHGGNGGCVVEIVELPDTRSEVDINEYSSWIDDLFYEGSQLPKEAGLYLFEGKATGFPGSDEMYRYTGEFTQIEI
jgi:hypothetical protein